MKTAYKPVILTEATINKFLSRIDKDGPLPDQSNPHYKGLDRCHQWTAGRGSGGYGKIWDGAQRCQAHRFAWELAFGLAGGLCVCHKCDNTVCVNPSHLFLGTYADNNRDKESKGRGNQPKGLRHGSITHPEKLARGDAHYARTRPERLRRGEAHGMAKLTTNDVIEIRSIYSNRATTQRELAKRFCVSHALIGYIVRRLKWSHV